MRCGGLSILTMLLSAAAAAASYDVYVAPNAPGGGNGAAAPPFRTIAQARDALRTARRARALAADKAVTIHLAPGVYRLETTLDLGAEDGGTPTAPVTYRAEPPGTARIQGGATLALDSFKPVTDRGVLARLDPAVRGNVLVRDLSALGRFEEFKTAYSGVPAGPWLYANAQPMPLARWPNADAPGGGWATFSEVVDNGLPQASAIDPAMKMLHPGSFVFDDPRPARWNLKEGVWLLGYWTHDWDEAAIRVAAYDKQRQVITLAAPHHYGIKGKTWGRSKRRFFALNLLEELDSPGEWYLDRPAKRLYFYPPAPCGAGVSPAEAAGTATSHGAAGTTAPQLVLATLGQPLLRLNGAKNVKLLGLRLEYSHGGGIVAQNAENVEIAGCVIANLGGQGITLHGKANTVRSCDLFNLGTGGISVSGGDRKTLQSAKNLLVNNHIHHYGLFKRTYAAGIHADGCGQIVRNNCIHDAPHNAVLYGGNEHLFELNEIYRVVLETGDAGAFYTGRDWTSQGNVLRHNFIHHLGGGDAKHTNTMGVYLDDCDCGDTIEGNIFLRAGRAIMVGGGRDNPVLNNLVVDCPIGLHIDSRGMTWREWNNPADPGWAFEEKAKKFNYTQPPWSAKYPRLAAIMHEHPREPLNNPVRRNVFVDCGKEVCNFDKGVQGLLGKLPIADNLVVNTRGANTLAAAAPYKGFAYLSGTAEKPIDLGFRDSNQGDFALRKNALLLKRLPSFKPIPAEKIGLVKDEYRHELPGR